MVLVSRIIWLGGALWIAGCAGPTTPLGPLSDWGTSIEGDGVAGRVSWSAGWNVGEEEVPSRLSRASVRFEPPRQVLHGARNLRVRIEDPSGIRDDFRLRVRFNGIDITRAFIRRSEVSISVDGREVTYDFEGLRLQAGSRSDIEILYGTESVLLARARLEPPRCLAHGPGAILNTDAFRPPKGILEAADRLARIRGFNPAFLAAVIAQESSFDPSKVSWARAIGLTQITPQAEVEIAEVFKDWPRYPGLNDLPAFWVRALVGAGQAHSGNEWRLDAERSIVGGLVYLRYLRSRSLSEDLDEDERTRVLLASYHSGPTRVAEVRRRVGERWLEEPELRAARTYVFRVLSYCDQFGASSGKEYPHENPTT